MAETATVEHYGQKVLGIYRVYGTAVDDSLMVQTLLEEWLKMGEAIADFNTAIDWLLTKRYLRPGQQGDTMYLTPSAFSKMRH